MDQALEVVVEMAESIWEGFRRALEDITPAEVNWRPLPEGNSISLIVKDGNVELWGFVGSQDAKDAIRVAVEVTPGVHQVLNNLVIETRPSTQ